MKTETTPPWKIITQEQLKQGWMELRGVTPVHHEYVVIEKIEDQRDGGRSVYKVRNPELWLLEHPVFAEKEHSIPPQYALAPSPRRI